MNTNQTPRPLTTAERLALVLDHRCTTCLATWSPPDFLCDCHECDVNASEREEADQSRCEIALEEGRAGDCYCGAHVPVPYTELRAGKPARSGIDWVRRQDFTPTEWDARRAEYLRTCTDEEVAS